MTAFSVALDTLFNDPNLSQAATYTPPGGSAGDCRVIVSMPDAIVDPFVGAPAVIADRLVDVRVAEAAPVDGGAFVFGGLTYRIVGAPVVPEDDPGRLTLRSAVKLEG